MVFRCIGKAKGFIFLFNPILLIHHINRYLHDYLAASVWLALGVAYYLHRKLKYKFLVFETYSSFVLALLINVVVGEIQIWEGVAAIFVLCIIGATEIVHQRSCLVNSQFRSVLMLSPFIVFAVLGYIFTFGEFEYVSYGFSIYSFLLL